MLQFITKQAKFFKRRKIKLQNNMKRMFKRNALIFSMSVRITILANVKFFEIH